ncbi:MAG: TIGR00303 family protein [Methanoregulaceae archaeon]|nr:TIGR00303 family protein [Methanoregulaceae archaeon]
MPFISDHPLPRFTKPAFGSILANTILSTVPGISGAGPTAEKTLLTPILDSELIGQGAITSTDGKPNTPTGCPTPAAITRAMMELTGIVPVFINAGLVHRPTVPCVDLYSEPGRDPRDGDAVPGAPLLFERGEWLGRLLSQWSDLLVLGECVPGGTTTALCVLRALGYPARVSSSFPENPVAGKEEVCRGALVRTRSLPVGSPLTIVQATGDPMMPVAAGLCNTYRGKVFLAGGTQMLAVAAVIKEMGMRLPSVVTTCYVRDDPTANVGEMADAIGVRMYSVDPGFGTIGHSGLARYCCGEVKEGMGAGGAMMLAYLMGFPPDTIRDAIFHTVSSYG